mgnify:CR=1 FL=1
MVVIIIFSLPTTIVWSETKDQIVSREGIYYKKFSDIPFTGTVYNYYENGQLEGKWELVDGKEHGVAKQFHPNGKLYYSAINQDGCPVNSKNINPDGSFIEVIWENCIGVLFKNFDREGNMVAKGKSMSEVTK